MTIYTVMGSTDRIEWVSKSFTCKRQAEEFRHVCENCAYTAGSLSELLNYSPDPKLHDKYNLRARRRIHYEVFSNELVTDAFMELTLQPHKPRNKFNKEFLWVQ